jgi:very-short-patch-repair endonuclease
MTSPRKASTATARALRRRASASEHWLWAVLRDRKLDGLKFRRQVAIGPYVADFLCHRHRLIVEADGPFHNVDRDETRDAWLAGQGFRVLRFANVQVTGDRNKVLAAILGVIEVPSATPDICDPSPLAGEGGPKGVG